MNDLSINLGRPADGLRITLDRRTNPQCTDYWDGNWISATVDVVVGGFRGNVEGNLRREEFVGFRDQIRRIYASLSGQAEFHTMEDWIGIRMEIQRTGHIKCDCFLMDYPGMGNRLTFQLSFDQTYLPALLDEIDAVLSTFPIIGAP